VPVYFGGLDPDAARVQLFAAGKNGAEAVRKTMNRGAVLAS